MERSQPQSTPSAAAIAVAKMVLYHDVFHHPLRVDELQRLIADDLGSAIAEAHEHGWVERDGRWVFRRGHRGDCALRMERTANAERIWPRARQAAAALARVPFVRGVLITGSLSKQSADPGSDVDFLLLVAPGRVWTVKIALQTFRRALPRRIRESLCTNYLLATDNLAIPQRSMYTAVELATALPMHGPEACVALLQANRWSTRFVPGFAASVARAEFASPLPETAAKAGLEAVLPQAAERAAQRAMSAFWDRRYGWLSEAERQRRFQRGEGVATNHLHDFSAYVATEFARRMAEAGVPGSA